MKILHMYSNVRKFNILLKVGNILCIIEYKVMDNQV